MKKRTIGVLTTLIILTGICAATTAATPITNLGYVDYYNTDDNYCFNETIPGDVTLTLIFSEVNGSAIKIEKMGYNSSGTNKTIYKFTTQKTYVDWWVTPGIKQFVFVDNNSNDLYQLDVNYSKAIIPENPWKERHRQLEEKYNQTMSNYNLTNSTQANITRQFDELNKTYNEFMLQFNKTLAENQNLSKNMSNLTASFDDLEDEYNTTYVLWESAVGNVTTLQTNYDGLSGDYDQLEKDHNDLSGAMPWYIIIAVIGTALFMFFYLRRKTIFEESSETTSEITTGYGKIHSAIDRSILSHFRKEPKTDEGRIEEITEWKEAPAGTSKDEFTSDEKEKIEKSLEDAKKGRITPLNVEKPDDVLIIMHEKIDANTRAINTKIDANAIEINTKIDRLFEGVDERITKLAKGTKA